MVWDLDLRLFPAQPNQPNHAEAPPPAPTHHTVPQEITYPERSSAPSQSVVSPASVPSRVPAAFLDRGDFFANSLLSAVSRLPDIRNQFFETLRMTEDDLTSFRGILSAQFNHWDDQVCTHALIKCPADTTRRG